MDPGDFVSGFWFGICLFPLSKENRIEMNFYTGIGYNYITIHKGGDPKWRLESIEYSMKQSVWSNLTLWFTVFYTYVNAI